MEVSHIYPHRLHRIEYISQTMRMVLCFVSVLVYNKTHVRGYFDTDLHEVSWHFVLNSTDWVKISVKGAIQNGFLFLSHIWKVNTAN